MREGERTQRQSEIWLEALMGQWAFPFFYCHEIFNILNTVELCKKEKKSDLEWKFKVEDFEQ